MDPRPKFYLNLPKPLGRHDTIEWKFFREFSISGPLAVKVDASTF